MSYIYVMGQSSLCQGRFIYDIGHSRPLAPCAILLKCAQTCCLMPRVISPVQQDESFMPCVNLLTQQDYCRRSFYLCSRTCHYVMRDSAYAECHTINATVHSTYAAGHTINATGHSTYAAGHTINATGHSTYAAGHTINATGHSTYVAGPTIDATGHSTYVAVYILLMPWVNVLVQYDTDHLCRKSVQ